MRRHLRRYFPWVAAVILIAAVIINLSYSPVEGSGKPAIPDSARSQPVAILEKEQWTTYRLPSGARRIRLLSRAFFAPDAEELVGKEFPYVLEYQLESLKMGTAIMAGAFNLRARVLPKVDEDGNMMAAAFFRDGEEIIAAAKVSTIDLVPGDVVTLKLRVRSHYTPVKGISARISYRQKVPERQLAYLWDRLSDAALENISRLRIHGLVDMTEEEKRAILENRWSPLGPQGIEGRDFSTRLLYTRNDLSTADLSLAQVGAGEMRCSPDLRAVVAIPEGEGCLRLVFRCREGGGKAMARVRYYGPAITKRRAFEHWIDGEQSEFEVKLEEGGLIEVESPIDVAVRPLWRGAGSEEILLEPAEFTSRTWIIGGADDQAVTYDIGGGEDEEEGGFFRAKVRAAGEMEAGVKFSIRDKTGEILSVGNWVLPAERSLYDTLISRDEELPANEPREVVVALPAGAKTIEFESGGHVLIEGFSRPTGLPHQTRVPADYQKYQPDLGRLPVWFGLRPVDAEERIRAHQSALIRVRERPPVDDLDILMGNYQWEDLVPRNGGSGRYLLATRDPEVPSRIEALPSLYFPLISNEDNKVPLMAPGGSGAPMRRLAYIRESNEPVELTLYSDNKPVFSRRLVSSRGELPLPSLGRDEVTMKVECDDPSLECFINYVRPEAATRLKRYVLRLEPGGDLLFECEKKTEGEEVVTGMFYASSTGGESAVLNVSIAADEEDGFSGNSDGHTVRERILTIDPNPSDSLPLLGGGAGAVDAGQRFFIPLRSDLKPGGYLIRVVNQGRSPGFLTMFKLTAGAYSDARFYKGGQDE